MTKKFSEAAEAAAQILTGRPAVSFLFLVENLLEDQFDHVDDLTQQDDDTATAMSTVNLCQLRAIRDHLHKLQNQSQND
ncbi:MAG: hypothetical protein MJZ96_01715 [Paludibacteraceae bacterium]|nr:hypothetical protein [Paludibacteraceae bacterium]